MFCNYYSLSLCRLHRVGNALIAWALFSVFVIRVLPVGYKMFTGYVYEKRRISDKGQVWLIENKYK